MEAIFEFCNYGQFQVNFPNRIALTIGEVEEIQILKELNKEMARNDVPTLVTLNVGELLSFEELYLLMRFLLN